MSLQVNSLTLCGILTPGAIAALATRMRHMPYPEAVTDRALMTKMTALFDTVFGTKRGKL